MPECVISVTRTFRSPCVQYVYGGLIIVFPLCICSVGYEMRICCWACENQPKYKSVCSGIGVDGGAGGWGDLARFVVIVVIILNYANAIDINI